MFNKYAIKHISYLRSVAQLRRAGARQPRNDGRWRRVSVNNLYALFSLSFFPILFSIFSISLSVFLFSDNTFALPSYSMSLSTSSPNITQDIKVSPVGKTIITPQTVTINSNNPNGIKLFISSKDDKLVPTKIKNTSPSEPEGPITPYIPSGYTAPMGNSNIPISPVPGDITNPSILNMNSFGFALPNESDNPLSYNFSNNNIYTSNDKNIKNTAKFSKLTNKHNPIEIYQNKSTITNKQLTVYYGTKINSVIDKGTYTLDILYTLIPNLAGPNTTPGQNNQEVLTIEEGNNNTLELTPAKLIKAQGGESLTIKVNSNLPNYNNADLNVNVYINNKQCSNTIIETLNPVSIKCINPANNSGKYDLKLRVSTKSGKVLVNFNKNNAVEYIEVTDMQAFTYKDCNKMNEHDIKLVRDTRDGELYTMTKLKDGKCWMTQNLRLKLNTSTTLTSADTDLNNTTSWTPTHTTEQFNGYRGSNWGGDYKADKSGFRPDNYNTHGIYYSHGSATANSARNLDNNGDEAPDSICPKGWRLPSTTTSHTGGEFYNMAQHYKGSASWSDSYWNGPHNMTNTPIPNFQYSGGYYHTDRSLYGISSVGYWWSSTISELNIAYSMYINSSYIKPRDSYVRIVGFNVRCILKDPSTVSDIQHMQDFTSQMCTKMTEHQTAALTDKRDNQQYTIAKLKDGKCWMTQNLRLKLDINKTLTPADTDIASNWTPPRSSEEGTSGAWHSDSEGYKTVRSKYQNSTYSNYGVYYTHSAVTAQSANNIDTDGQNAPHSICPKGWKLPTSSSTYKQGDFWNLAKAYKSSMSEGDYYFSGSSNSNTLISGTPSFPLSGYYVYGGIFNDVGSYGWFWSSTVSSSAGAYNLGQNSSALDPHGYRNRYYGFSARCVAR